MKTRKIHSKADREAARAAAAEEAACKTWLKEIGIPLMRKDLQKLERAVKVKREARNATIYEAFEMAAQIAELAEKKQDADHGSANTGGASLAARVIRAYASGFKGYQQDDQ